MTKDHETEQFAKLTGKLKHFCPDWDGLAIDETCPEISGCSCDFPQYDADAVFDIITAASESWPPETEEMRKEVVMDAAFKLERSQCFVRIAELELRIIELENAIMISTNILHLLSMATESSLRERICTASNRLDAVLGRPQSSHGEKF